MKRLLITLFAVSATLFASAQDVIFLGENDSIVAKVISIGTSEITYQKWTNLEGPVYSLSISQIVAIRYQNGTIDDFNIHDVGNNEENSASIPDDFVWRYKFSYMVGEQEMSKLEFQQWLKEQQCWEAYNQFRKGRSITIAGWLLMSVGVAEGLGVTLLGLAGGSSKKSNNSTLRIGMAVFGGCLVVASVPTIVVGYKKMHNAVDVYNVSCSKNKLAVQPYWAVQASSDGIGLAYHF